MMRGILYGLLLVLVAAVGVVGYQVYRANFAGEAYGVPFTLTDQNGEPITEKAFQETPTAVFFGFTHCPEICPTTLFELDGWLKALGDDGKEIKAYFVSVDPARDTPRVIRDYVSNVSDRITGITGDPAKMAEMLKGFHIYYKRIETTGDDYTMDHFAGIVLLDRKGAFAGTIAYGENPDTAIQKLRNLARG